jgi:hypothetical protein
VRDIAADTQIFKITEHHVACVIPPARSPRPVCSSWDNNAVTNCAGLATSGRRPRRAP